MTVRGGPNSVDRANVSDEIVDRMFQRMAVTREIEIVMAKHVRDKPFSGWWHPGEGQEGAQLGASTALSKSDYLFYQGRGVGWVIGKGMSCGAVLGDLLGKASGSTRGKGGGVPHWADYSLGIMGEGATLGSVYALAAGAAFSAKLRRSGEVALADFGDGTAARGTFHETLVHAAAWKLPLIYFCENNGWIVGTTLKSVSPTENIVDYASGYHIPGISVDGQDAVAVYLAVKAAIERARAGEGPSLIEAKVTRRRGHYAGDPQKYRPPDDLAGYRDPLDLLRQRISAGTAERLMQEARKAVAEAYDRACVEPDPDPSVIFQDLYYVA